MSGHISRWRMPRGPTDRVLSSYPDFFTGFERKELLNYSYIYYFGGSVTKYTTPDVMRKRNFDKADGHYDCAAGDHIAYRYEVLRKIGEGFFSKVLEVYDHKDDVRRALKITRNNSDFSMMVSEERKMLHKLKEMDPKRKLNIVHVVESFEFRKHMCHTFEVMTCNLEDLMRSSEYGRLDLNVIKILARSILKGLEGLSQFGVIHGDLKPQNIVLTRHGDFNAKIIDFGTSSFCHDLKYEYVQTRPYRAPEVVLQLKFDTKIDIWSVGCILAELYMGGLLFPAGSEFELMARIMEMLGVPPTVMTEASNVGWFFVYNGKCRYCYTITGEGQFMLKDDFTYDCRDLGMPGSKPIKHILHRANNDAFVNLVENFLTWDPALRISAEAALKHLWFEEPSTSTPKLKKPEQGESSRVRKEVRWRCPLATIKEDLEPALIKTLKHKPAYLFISRSLPSIHLHF